MSNATFSSPDLDAFSGLDGLGLTVTDQYIEPGQAALECRVLEGRSVVPTLRPGGCSSRDGDQEDRARPPRMETDDAAGQSTPLPLQRLLHRVAPRHHDRCRVGTKLSREAVLWALKSVVTDRMSVARVAGKLGTAWHTVNEAVL